MVADMWELVYYLYRFILTLFIGGGAVFAIRVWVSLIREERGVPPEKARIPLKWSLMVYLLVVLLSMTQAYISKPLKQLKFEVIKMKSVVKVTYSAYETSTGHRYKSHRSGPTASIVFHLPGNPPRPIGTCMEMHFADPKILGHAMGVQIGRLIPTSCDRLGEVIPTEGTYEQRVALWEQNLAELDHLSGQALYQAMRARYGLKPGDPYPP